MAVFAGFVDDAGMFVLDDRKGFAAYVKKFKGQEVVLTLKKRPRLQGTQAMRYYRGVVVPDVARASGVTDPDEYDAVHEALAWKFLKLPPHPVFGTPRRKSTSKGEMSMEEMSRYIDEVITWAETSIPDCRVRRPHEVDLENVA